MASGHQEDHEAGLRSGDRRGRDDYCDDPRRRWKNSLRPLDPGILSDVKKKKKERFGLSLQIKQRSDENHLLFLDHTAWPAVYQ